MVGREYTGGKFFLVGVGMSKFSASGERIPPHLPSRKNPGLDRILILEGLLMKREVTFFKGETVFTKK